MTSILAASAIGRRRRSTTPSAQDHADSSASSRHRSSSFKSRSASQSSPQLDDWSAGFTGIVDFDRKMREVAMSEQCFPPSGEGGSPNIYDPYSSHPSFWAEQQPLQSSSSEKRQSSGSHSTTATERSQPLASPNLNASSSSLTTATSRLTRDSHANPSLLTRRRSSDSARSSLRLAPLPASATVFGNYRLTHADTSSVASSARLLSTFSPSSWSSVEEPNALTPIPVATRQLEPLTPGTAAAATWTDSTAPGYFPAGLVSADSSKKTFRPLRRKAARAPLPRLVSGEVVSSPTAVSEGLRRCVSASGTRIVDPDANEAVSRSAPPSTRDHSDRKEAGCASAPSTHFLRRSAQSLALGLRFRIIRARRRVSGTGHSATAHGSTGNPVEPSLLS